MPPRFSTSMPHYLAIPRRVNVVEIGLLLPADWAVALVDLAKKRHQSVGELLRMYIGHALIENDASFDICIDLGT